ncbi:hypothetical protein Ae201684P_005749 [Aphanomyces euteiches]|nr:hypothetical protein Ae201684P_005749 [Aphanomyces euteiches]
MANRHDAAAQVAFQVFERWKRYVQERKQKKHQVLVAAAYFELVGLHAALGKLKACVHNPRRRRRALYDLYRLDRWKQFRDIRRKRRINGLIAFRHAKGQALGTALCSWRNTAKVRRFQVVHRLGNLLSAWKELTMTSLSATLLQVQPTESAAASVTRPPSQSWKAHLITFRRHLRLRRVLTAWRYHCQWVQFVLRCIMQPYLAWLMHQAWEDWKRSLMHQKFHQLLCVRVDEWMQRRSLRRHFHRLKLHWTTKKRLAHVVVAFQRRRQRPARWFYGWKYLTRRARLIHLKARKKELQMYANCWKAWRLYIYQRLGKHSADVFYRDLCCRRYFKLWKLFPHAQDLERRQNQATSLVMLSSAFSTWRHWQTCRVAWRDVHVQAYLEADKRYFYLWSLAMEAKDRMWHMQNLDRRFRQCIRRWIANTLFQKYRKASIEMAEMFHALMLIKFCFSKWRQRPKRIRRRARDFYTKSLQVKMWRRWKQAMLQTKQTLGPHRQVRDRFRHLSCDVQRAARLWFLRGIAAWVWSKWRRSHKLRQALQRTKLKHFRLWKYHYLSAKCLVLEQLATRPATTTSNFYPTYPWHP